MALKNFLTVGSDGNPNFDVSFDKEKVNLLVDMVKTVQASGGDSTTIQGAIDLFDDTKLGDDNRVDVEAGTYDEFLDLASIYGLIVFRGDTRGLSGHCYGHNKPIRSTATNAGSGTCTINKSGGSQLTITGSGGNPDFGADGWGNGDSVFVFRENGTLDEETIDSVSGNVINFTNTVNNIGVDGGSFVLVPNRKIKKTTSAGRILDHTNAFLRIRFEGFYIESQVTPVGDLPRGMLNIEEGARIDFKNCYLRDTVSTAVYVADGGYCEFDGAENTISHCPQNGIDCRMAEVKSDGLSIIHCDTNCIRSDFGGVVDAENANIIAETSFTIVRAQGNGILNLDNSDIRSTNGTTSGITASRGGVVTASSANVASNTQGSGDGIQATVGGSIFADSAVVDNFQVCFDIAKGSFANVDNGSGINASTGVFSERNSYVSALNTSGNFGGTGTDYNPATSDVVGNVNSVITHS